jgi:hypothetical protein
MDEKITYCYRLVHCFWGWMPNQTSEAAGSVERGRAQEFIPSTPQWKNDRA